VCVVVIELLSRRKLFWAWKDGADTQSTPVDAYEEIEACHDFEIGHDLKFHRSLQPDVRVKVSPGFFTLELIGTRASGSSGFSGDDLSKHWAVFAHEMAHVRVSSLTRLLLDLLAPVEITTRTSTAPYPRTASRAPRCLDGRNPHTEAVRRLPPSTLPRAAIRCPSNVPAFELQPDPRDALAA